MKKTRVTTLISDSEIQKFDDIAAIIGISKSELFAKILEIIKIKDFEKRDWDYDNVEENEIAFRVTEETKEKLTEISQKVKLAGRRRELIFAIVVTTNQKFAFDKEKLIQKIKEIFES